MVGPGRFMVIPNYISHPLQEFNVFLSNFQRKSFVVVNIDSAGLRRVSRRQAEWFVPAGAAVWPARSARKLTRRSLYSSASAIEVRAPVLKRQGMGDGRTRKTQLIAVFPRKRQKRQGMIREGKKIGSNIGEKRLLYKVSPLHWQRKMIESIKM